jgi:hypothetical protein
VQPDPREYYLMMATLRAVAALEITRESLTADAHPA